MVVTRTSDGDFNVSVYGEIFTASNKCSPLIDALNNARAIELNDIKQCGDSDEARSFIEFLYKVNALFIKRDDTKI